MTHETTPARPFPATPDHDAPFQDSAYTVELDEHDDPDDYEVHDLSWDTPDPPADAPREFDPVPRRRQRKTGWTVERQRVFIATLADTGLVKEAAADAGLSARSAYQLRRAPGGEAFARAWEMALAQASRSLTDIAFERAISGVREPVFDKDGNMKGMRCKLNDRLLMFLLRHHRRGQYGIGGEKVMNMDDRAEHESWKKGNSPLPDALAALTHSDMPVHEDGDFYIDYDDAQAHENDGPDKGPDGDPESGE